MAILSCRNRPPVRPTRRTARPAGRFGDGILPRTYWRGSYGWMPDPTDAAYAAQSIADGEPTDADWDRLAADTADQRRWEDLYAIDYASGGRCGSCGLRSDFLDSNGLCPPCEIAAEDSTQASQRMAVGLPAKAW